MASLPVVKELQDRGRPQSRAVYMVSLHREVSDEVVTHQYKSSEVSISQSLNITFHQLDVSWFKAYGE